MTIRLGVVMDPIENITFKKDTTLAMLWAASDRGWKISYMRQQDLYLEAGEPRANCRSLQVFRDANHFYGRTEPTHQRSSRKLSRATSSRHNKPLKK